MPDHVDDVAGRFIADTKLRWLADYKEAQRLRAIERAAEYEKQRRKRK